ncbi:hypothetical protein OTU49_004882, partial [Cherax quadricarinatus]
QYRGHGVTECVLVTTAHWARLTVVARETCVVGRGSEGTIMAEVRPESVDSDDDFVYVTEAGLEQAPRPEEKGLQVPSQSPPLKLVRHVSALELSCITHTSLALVNNNLSFSLMSVR